jgi:hypothetical protein
MSIPTFKGWLQSQGFTQDFENPRRFCHYNDKGASVLPLAKEKAAELGVQFSVDNDGPSPVIYSIRNKK